MPIDYNGNDITNDVNLEIRNIANILLNGDKYYIKYHNCIENKNIPIGCFVKLINSEPYFFTPLSRHDFHIERLNKETLNNFIVAEAAIVVCRELSYNIEYDKIINTKSQSIENFIRNIRVA